MLHEIVRSGGALGSEYSITAPFQDAASPAAPPLLLQYWQTVLRWKWSVLGIIVTALALGIVITLLTTPVYTATARVEISREQQNVTKMEGLESPQASRDDEFYQTQYSLLAARSLAERVAREMRLATNNEFFAAHGQELDSGILFGRGSTNITPAERQRRERLAVDLLLKNVTIAPITRSRLVDVRYTSASPHLATDIANTWVQQFIAASIDRRFDSTVNARKFLEGRIAELGQKLETSERAAVGYASRKGIVSLGQAAGGPDGRVVGADRTLVVSDLEAINTALLRATAERIAAESRLKSKSGTTADALANETIAGLRQRRAEASAEYAKLLVQFEPEYPAAQAVAQQVRALDASIAREEGRVSASRRAEYVEASEREANLRSRLDTLKERLIQQNRDTIQYNIFRREADTNRELYDSLLQRYKEIGVAGVALSNIAIVDVAKVPDAPSSPKLMINLALALVAGVGLAFLAVLGLEQIDEGLRDPGSVGTLLRLPLLGAVPNLEAEETPLGALGDAKSAMSEAYLSVQSNLAFSTEHGFPRSLMVTSSRPAEGKTTTSVALATVLGRTGKRVILIDADMRSPSAHKFFGLGNKAGLSNYLAGDDNWKGFVAPTSFKGLHLLSGGPTPPSAAELLSGERMLHLLRQLAENFDHVIVDSPPILGLADAPLLSRAVEGCVFVVEAEGVPVRGLRSVLARLHQAQATIFGVIVTKLDRRQAGYGYGYGYGYGFNYGKLDAA